MTKKKLTFILKIKDREVFKHESTKGDSFSFNEDSKKLTLHLKGDVCAEMEDCRFDNIQITSGKETFKKDVRSYGKLLDNGNTKITFNTL